MTKEELLREVAKIQWYHSIDLGHGIITPGMDKDPQGRLRQFGIPRSLKGKTVLDVGAWDGFFSFEAERRGAKRVLAVDSYCWSGPGWGTKAGFELARRALNSSVEDMEIEVLDITPERVGTFDVVFFLGVLYHMRHPFLALERVASVTGEQLILETHVDLLNLPRPAMAFYPGAELNNDTSNWCGPNLLMIETMLKDVGFRQTKVVSGPALYPGVPNQGRVVYHAWR